MTSKPYWKLPWKKSPRIPFYFYQKSFFSFKIIIIQQFILNLNPTVSSGQNYANKEISMVWIAQFQERISHNKCDRWSLNIEVHALSAAVGAERINILFFFRIHWLNTQVGMNSTSVIVCVCCQTIEVVQRTGTWDTSSVATGIEVMQWDSEVFPSALHILLYFHKILHGLWRPLTQGYNTSFQLQPKNFYERCNTDTSLALVIISPFISMPDWNQITLYSHLEILSLPIRLYSAYASLHELYCFIEAVLFYCCYHCITTAHQACYVWKSRRTYLSFSTVHCYMGAQLQLGGVLQELG